MVLFAITNIDWINPNDATLADLAADDYSKVLSIAVFMGPIVEEVLFRGVIFGALQKRDRLAAYIVSVLLFALLHVWQYAVADQSATLLLYMLDYIPIGLFWPGVMNAAETFGLQLSSIWESTPPLSPS